MTSDRGRERPISLMYHGLGEFARALGASLRDDPQLHTRIENDLEIALHGEDGSATLVAASWRPEGTFFSRVEESCRAVRRRWLPVVFRGTSIQVGPLVVPDVSPCYACFAAREAVRGPLGPRGALVRDAYDEDPDFGVRGYAAIHVTAARAMIKTALRNSPGVGITLHLLEERLESTHAVTITGCPRCGYIRGQA
ncbi:MAG: hypothetical protein QOH16_691 [Gaiellaceae bacterium]|nr:hypothetical protein [Gaiellaceae bacterium]